MNAKRLMLASVCAGAFAFSAGSASAQVITFDMDLDATQELSGGVTNVESIQFRWLTQTLQYVQDESSPVQPGDVFFDRGYGTASSYLTPTDVDAPQTGPDFRGITYSMGMLWDNLRGEIKGAEAVGGNWIVNAEYTSSDNFELFVSDLSPGFGQDYEAAQAFFSAGEKIMEMELTKGNSALEFESQGGAFIEGTFTFEFNIIDVLPGFWFTSDGDDFADLIENEGGKQFLVTAFASAGTLQEPGPETFFGDDIPNTEAEESQEGQTLFSETRSRHDGSLRFAVPEPGTLALMGTALLLLGGLLGLGGIRRRATGPAQAA